MSRKSFPAPAGAEDNLAVQAKQFAVHDLGVKDFVPFLEASDGSHAQGNYKRPASAARLKPEIANRHWLRRPHRLGPRHLCEMNQ